MRRALLLGLTVLLLGSRVGFSTEQTVEPIVPRGEQQIEVIAPPGEQVVSGIGAGAGEQQVEPQVAPSQAAKTASNVAKAVTGVTAAAVSLGAMAAMLMFL
jgi:hypothetical protein